MPKSEPHETRDERYEVQHDEAQRALKTLAVLIEEHIPDGFGFSLQLFSFGDGGQMFYISNAQRDDMVATLEELLAKWKQDRE